MKQFSIFNKSLGKHESDPKDSHPGNCWTLYVDGASRNNPGPAGAGVYLLKNNEPFLKKGFFLGTKTNNQAEYLALLIGLFFLDAQLSDHDMLKIFSDSQLLVRQLKQEYRVKHPDLIPLYACARSFLKDKPYIVKHIMREHNAVADELANIGIDNKNKHHIPSNFENFCMRHQ